jgi:hypothetical protein
LIMPEAPDPSAAANSVSLIDFHNRSRNPKGPSNQRDNLGIGILRRNIDEIFK